MAVIKVTERQILKEFLALYKDSPCLWYQVHPLYTNREAREQAYEVLLEKFKILQEDATIDTVKKKIDNLRCAYKRERKKVQTSMAEGDEPHKPILWYYNLLRFIDDAADDSNMDRTSSLHLEDADYEFEEDECLPSPKSKKIKKEVSSIFIPDLQDEDGAITQSQQRDSLHCDYGAYDSGEAESFGRTIGLQLKELEPVQRYIAEKLISEVIFYGRLDKLNTQSNISLNQEL